MTEPEQIQVTVPFAAGSGTYHHDYTSTTTAQAVVQDALQFYGVNPADGTRYYLVTEGTEIAPTQTLGSLLEHGRALRLPLRTETVSG